MAYLTKDDLVTHVYPEVRDEISRQDDTIVDKAIQSAIEDAIGYLNRYDVVALFGIYGETQTPPTIRFEGLDNKVKDIACWYLLKLGNPNVNVALFRTSYEDAIKFFAGVQTGRPDPPWPLRPDDPTTPNDDSGNIEFRSLPKRINHY